MNVDRFHEIWRAGLATATRLGTELDPPTGDCRVLSNRGNLIVHLSPAPVIVRVATLTAWTRRDPFAWMAREVAVASYAAARGAPIVPPASRADPGPHRRNGFVLSLWTYFPPGEQQADALATGETLALLHQTLTDCPEALPLLSPIREQIDEGLAALEREHVVEHGQVTALRSRHEQVLAELDDVSGTIGVLHGDAHPGNLLNTHKQWFWTDLEETCRGPREWDLAVLAHSCQTDGKAALRAYAAVAATPIPPADVLAPFIRARELEAAVWALGMAHQYPARYRPLARTLLDVALK